MQNLSICNALKDGHYVLANIFQIQRYNVDTNAFFLMTFWVLLIYVH